MIYTKEEGNLDENAIFLGSYKKVDVLSHKYKSAEVTHFSSIRPILKNNLRKLPQFFSEIPELIVYIHLSLSEFELEKIAAINDFLKKKTELWLEKEIIEQVDEVIHIIDYLLDRKDNEKDEA